MPDRFILRGFVGKHREPEAAKEKRVPPGQYITRDFPVLSAGPTPRVPLAQWKFTLEGLVKEPARWTWEEFLKLPAQTYVVDISCVTKWTKLDMKWKGVSVDTFLEHVELDPKAKYVTAYTVDGYKTNLPLPDASNGQAFGAYEYDDKPGLRRGHGAYRADAGRDLL